MNRKITNCLIALIVFSTLFISSSHFIDKEILPKWYALMWCAALGGVFFILTTKKIILDRLSFAVVAFIGYLMLRSVFPYPDVFNLLCLASFLLLFFLFKSVNGSYTTFTTCAIIIAAVLQGVYGLLQFSGALSFYSNFSILGSYDNPAGFSACLAASLPFCFTIPKGGRIGTILKILTTTILWTCIILSGSRAGIVAAGAVTFLYLGKKYWFILAHKRVLILSVFALVLIAASIGLFIIKKDSATGRLLIWKVSTGMITEAPVFGSGSGAFKAQYMPHQAQYFEVQPDSRYAMLADNVTHPFNEYLSLTIEHGSIGLLMLLIVLYFVFSKTKDIANPFFLCMLAIGLFSCFSYPFKYAYIVVLCAYCLATYSTGREFRVHWILKAGMLVFILFFGWFAMQDLLFEVRWKKLTNQVSLGKMAVVTDDYTSLYNQWKSMPLFLYNYGAVLNTSGCYTESLVVLKNCEIRFNDYDVQMLIADNYNHLHNYKPAVERYILAHNMVPCRFLPLYKLMLLYQATGNAVKAKEMAQIIINKKIKVESSSIATMKRKAEELWNVLNIP